MDRGFLYGIIVLLSLTDLVIYIQKTDPNLIAKIMPSTSQDSSWQSKDPGWDKKPEAEKKEEKKDSTEEKKDVAPEEEKSQAEPRKKHRFFR